MYIFKNAISEGRKKEGREGRKEGRMEKKRREGRGKGGKMEEKIAIYS